MWQGFSWGDSTQVCSPQIRSPRQAKAQVPSKSNLVGPEFYWFYLQDMGQGLFTGTEMTQTAALVRHIPARVTAHERWEPRVCCPACRGSMGWQCPFQITRLLYYLPESRPGLRSLCSFLCSTVNKQSLLLTVGRRGLANLVSVKDFLKLLGLVYHLS